MNKTVRVMLFSMLTLFAGGSAFAVSGFTEVNNALFDKAHLKNIKEPTKLMYSYNKESFTDEPREDSISVNVTNLRKTGRADTSFEFFTGEHNRPYQARENQQGNSVFMLFLEYDVRQMKEQTGGEWRYFQKRIRWALADGADKKEIEVDYNGEKVDATQYVIQPFIDDPKNSRYKIYANKYYIFTLSEAVPGEIYEVRTVVPDGADWSDGEPVLIEERVRLENTEKL